MIAAAAGSHRFTSAGRAAGRCRSKSSSACRASSSLELLLDLGDDPCGRSRTFAFSVSTSTMRSRARGASRAIAVVGQTLSAIFCAVAGIHNAGRVRAALPPPVSISIATSASFRDGESTAVLTTATMTQARAMAARRRSRSCRRLPAARTARLRCRSSVRATTSTSRIASVDVCPRLLSLRADVLSPRAPARPTAHKRPLRHPKRARQFGPPLRAPHSRTSPLPTTTTRPPAAKPIGEQFGVRFAWRRRIAGGLQDHALFSGEQ